MRVCDRTSAPLHAAVVVQDAGPLLGCCGLVVRAEVDRLPAAAPALLLLAPQHHAAVANPGRGQRGALHAGGRYCFEVSKLSVDGRWSFLWGVWGGQQVGQHSVSVTHQAGPQAQHARMPAYT